MGFVQLWDKLANSQIFLKKIEVIKSISQTHSSSLFRPQLVPTHPQPCPQLSFTQAHSHQSYLNHQQFPAHRDNLVYLNMALKFWTYIQIHFDLLLNQFYPFAATLTSQTLSLRLRLICDKYLTTTQIGNWQFAIVNLKLAICNLQFAICKF